MDWMKWLIGGLGAVVLYELYQSSVNAASSSPTAPTASSTTIVSTTVPNVPSSPSVNSLNAEAAIARTSPTAIVNAAIAAGYPAPQSFNASQWNYFFTKVTGVPSWGLGDNGQPMDINTYWVMLVTSAANLKGLGMIIDLASLYKGAKQGSGFGVREFTAGLKGLGVIVDDPNNSAAYIDETGMVAATKFNGSQDSTTVDFYNAVQAGGLTVYDS